MCKNLCIFMYILFSLELKVSSYHSDIRLRKMMMLLHTYKIQHSINSLRNEQSNNLCKRKYIFSYQYPLTCKLAGNAIGIHLAGMAAAIVLNRTYIAPHHFQDCTGSIELKKWLPLLDEVRQLTNSAGCELPSLYPLCRGNTDTEDKECVLAYSDIPILAFDDLSNTAYDTFHPTRGIPMPEAIHERSRTLFSSNDRFEAFGLIQWLAYDFTNKTKSLARPILKKIYGETYNDNKVEPHVLKTPQKILTIGVHLRHFDEKSLNDSTLDVRFDEKILDALKRIRKVDSTSACMVLIASDRAPSIVRVTNYAKVIGCNTSYIDRDLNATVESNAFVMENGPWANGLLSIADWYLLTHSMYFIGTAQSTFSFLIANGVAAHATWKANVGDNQLFYWISEHLETSDVARFFGNCTCIKGKASWEYKDRWPI